jgi:hypothetical protein
MWLLQIDVYPSWRYVPTVDFGPAQSLHFLAVCLGVFPFAVATTVISIMFLVRRPTFLPLRAVQVGAAIQALTWVLTALVYGPLQGKLTEPVDALTNPARTLGPANPSVYQALLFGHWGRVLLVTAYAVLAWWLAANVFVHVAGRMRAKVAG